MKKLVALLFAIFILSSFMPVYGDQWKMFEHRYEYKLEDVLPAAKFVQKKGYWEGYKDNKLVGYVLISKEWTSRLIGYSGKHLETLIGIDTNNTITGVKLLFHSEPIVLIGLKEEHYLNFIKQYKGKSIKEPLSLGKEISIDAVTGATVTAVVQNSIILESARKVADAAGTLKAAKGKGQKISQKYSALSWDELKKAGALKNLLVTSKELGIEGEDAYLDLHVAVITPPSIGRNLLGDRYYNDVMTALRPGESAVAIFSKGKGSFKGTGFVRGGTFDRFNIEQGAKVFMFADRDYRVLSELNAKGAPSINEGGVFVIRDKEFDPAEPFKLNLLLPYRTSAVKKEFRSFSAEYKIPERFLE
ncbi:MAG: FMN-binding protein [Nitrospirae bacterium]|nr:FMN-binding protein [Nitrospirota bacterium]